MSNTAINYSQLMNSQLQIFWLHVLCRWTLFPLCLARLPVCAAIGLDISSLVHTVFTAFVSWLETKSLKYLKRTFRVDRHKLIKTKRAVFVNIIGSCVYHILVHGANAQSFQLSAKVWRLAQAYFFIILRTQRHVNDVIQEDQDETA